MTERLLAIDFGRTFGWCYNPMNESGSIFLESDDVGARFSQYYGWVHMQFEKGIDRVAYEMPTAYHQPKTMSQHGFYEGVIKMFCHTYKVPYTAVFPITLKQFICGTSKAKKDDMLKLIRTLYPNIEIYDDNHCDAICIWQWGKSEQAQADEVERLAGLDERRAEKKKKKMERNRINKAKKMQKNLF